MADTNEYEQVKNILLNSGVPEDEIPEPVREDPADVAEDNNE